MKILKEFGWYEGREIEIEYIILDLLREGFRQPCDQIIKLFKCYWNIGGEFRYESGGFSSFHLNVDRAIERIDNSLLENYEQVLNKELIPVGTIHFDTGLILISQEMEFYMAYNGELYFLGNNLIETLDAIINKTDILKIL